MIAESNKEISIQTDGSFTNCSIENETVVLSCYSLFRRDWKIRMKIEYGTTAGKESTCRTVAAFITTKRILFGHPTCSVLVCTSLTPMTCRELYSKEMHFRIIENHQKFK